MQVLWFFMSLQYTCIKFKMQALGVLEFPAAKKCYRWTDRQININIFSACTNF